MRRDRPLQTRHVPQSPTPSRVGVDYGTLSGPGRRGPGQRRRRARHGRLRVPARRPRPGAAASSPAARPARPRLGAAGARRLRRGAAHRRARRARAAGVDPAEVIGIATDFTACTMVPTTADGTPLCELREYARRAARLRQALEAPRRAAAGRPDQRAGPRARRGLAARYGGLISSEWEFAKGLQLLEEAPEVYAAMDALGRGRRLDRLAALRHLRPQRLHRRLQGHPPGRRLPDAATSSPRSTPTSPASSTTSSTHRSASSAPRRHG